MKKSIEIMQNMRGLKNQIEAKMNEKAFEEAEKLSENLKTLKAQYDAAVEIENEEKKGKTQMQINTVADKKKTFKNAFNKMVLKNVFGEPLTEAEQAYSNKVKMVVGPGQVGATGAKGGYLIPQEFITPIAEARSELVELKNLCTVKAVNRLTGVMPVCKAETAALSTFDENETIANSAIDFSQVTYNVKAYKDIVPVSNELLADADVDLVSFVDRRFARKAVNAENKAIIDALDTVAETTITDYKGIIKALNTKLDTAIAANAVIITNQDGFDYLDELTDANGVPVLTRSFADEKTALFRGHPIVVLNNATIKTVGKKLPFYAGSLEDFLYFFERSGVELAADSSAGFTSNTTYLRVIERFDAVKVNEEAMVKLTITVTE